jgi:hypothetical protein
MLDGLGRDIFIGRAAKLDSAEQGPGVSASAVNAIWSGRIGVDSELSIIPAGVAL